MAAVPSPGFRLRTASSSSSVAAVDSATCPVCLDDMRADGGVSASLFLGDCGHAAHASCATNLFADGCARLCLEGAADRLPGLYLRAQSAGPTGFVAALDAEARRALPGLLCPLCVPSAIDAESYAASWWLSVARRDKPPPRSRLAEPLSPTAWPQQRAALGGGTSHLREATAPRSSSSSSEVASTISTATDDYSSGVARGLWALPQPLGWVSARAFAAVVAWSRATAATATVAAEMAAATPAVTESEAEAASAKASRIVEPTLSAQPAPSALPSPPVPVIVPAHEAVFERCVALAQINLLHAVGAQALRVQSGFARATQVADEAGLAVVTVACPNFSCGVLLAVPAPVLKVGKPVPPSHVSCPACGYGVCSSCGRSWRANEDGLSHAGASCASHGATLRYLASLTFSLDVFRSEKGDGAKLCPSPTCGRAITRYRGHRCHHVTCSCGLSICYVCLGRQGRCTCPMYCIANTKSPDSDVCGCQPCPICASGPEGHAKCGECPHPGSPESPCPPCCLGGRHETVDELASRLAREEAAIAAKRLREPSWPGPQIVSRVPLASPHGKGSDPELDLSRSAEVGRLGGAAAIAREALQLLAAVHLDSAPAADEWHFDPQDPRRRARKLRRRAARNREEERHRHALRRSRMLEHPVLCSVCELALLRRCPSWGCRRCAYHICPDCFAAVGSIDEGDEVTGDEEGVDEERESAGDDETNDGADEDVASEAEVDEEDGEDVSEDNGADVNEDADEGSDADADDEANDEEPTRRAQRSRNSVTVRAGESTATSEWLSRLPRSSAAALDEGLRLLCASTVVAAEGPSCVAAAQPFVLAAPRPPVSAPDATAAAGALPSPPLPQGLRERVIPRDLSWAGVRFDDDYYASSPLSRCERPDSGLGFLLRLLRATLMLSRGGTAASHSPTHFLNLSRARAVIEYLTALLQPTCDYVRRVAAACEILSHEGVAALTDALEVDVAAATAAGGAIAGAEAAGVLRAASAISSALACDSIALAACAGFGRFVGGERRHFLRRVATAMPSGSHIIAGAWPAALVLLQRLLALSQGRPTSENAGAGASLALAWVATLSPLPPRARGTLGVLRLSLRRSRALAVGSSGAFVPVGAAASRASWSWAFVLTGTSCRSGVLTLAALSSSGGAVGGRMVYSSGDTHAVVGTVESTAAPGVFFVELSAKAHRASYSLLLLLDCRPGPAAFRLDGGLRSSTSRDSADFAGALIVGGDVAAAASTASASLPWPPLAPASAGPEIADAAPLPGSDAHSRLFEAQRAESGSPLPAVLPRALQRLLTPLLRRAAADGSAALARVWLALGASTAALSLVCEGRGSQSRDWSAAFLLFSVGVPVDTRVGLDLTPLGLACHAADVKAASKLLAFGANANAVTRAESDHLLLSTWAPLTVLCGAAAWSGDHVSDDAARRLEIAKLLVRGGADLEQATDHGSTALLLACASGNVGLAMFLLDSKADAFVSRKDGSTAVLLAAKIACVPLLHRLLERHVPCDGASAESRRSVLHWIVDACLRGTATASLCDIVPLLLRGGAPLEAKDADGLTPAMLLLESGVVTGPSFAILRALLEAGAKVLPLPDGTTALMRACDTSGGSHFGVSFRSQRYHDRHRDMTALALLLISSGADVAVGAGPRGLTALHLEAACRESPTVLSALLARGADLEARTVARETPLLFAIAHCRHGYGPLLLLQRGADVLAADSKGETALHKGGVRLGREPHFATLYRDLLAAAVAAPRGGGEASALEARDAVHSRTPLHSACDAGAHTAVAMLLDAGADASAADAKGKTALHLCVGKPALVGSDGVLDTLLARGADVAAVDKDGVTPLRLSCGESACLVSARALLACGSNDAALRKAACSADAKGVAPLAAISSRSAESWHTGIAQRDDKDAWTAVARQLLDLGADVDQGGTAARETNLLAAVRGHNEPLAALLIERGAKLDAVVAPPPTLPSSGAAAAAAAAEAAANAAAAEADAAVPEAAAGPMATARAAALTALAAAREAAAVAREQAAAAQAEAEAAAAALAEAEAWADDEDGEGDDDGSSDDGDTGNDSEGSGEGAEPVTGDTALIAACRFSMAATALLLLEFGADPRVANADGETALSLCRADKAAREALAPVFKALAVRGVVPDDVAGTGAGAGVDAGSEEGSEGSGSSTDDSEAYDEYDDYYDEDVERRAL